MLTEKEGKMFSRIIDMNWEAKEETNSVKKMELMQKLINAKVELQLSMGKEKYEHFMSQGKKMFS